MRINLAAGWFYTSARPGPDPRNRLRSFLCKMLYETRLGDLSAVKRPVGILTDSFSLGTRRGSITVKSIIQTYNRRMS